MSSFPSAQPTGPTPGSHPPRWPEPPNPQSAIPNPQSGAPPSDVPRPGPWWWRFWTGASREYLRCGECGAGLLLRDLPPGRRARCGACGSVFRVPGQPASLERTPEPATTPTLLAPTVLAPPTDVPAPTEALPPSTGERPAERRAGAMPESLGPYRLEAELARGGTAIVYRGRHAALNKAVAIKVLLPHLDEAKEMSRRLFREALALARFRHPHIVPVLDAGTAPNGLPYLVMEYVEGGDIAGKLRRDGPLPWREALEILVQVTEAVDFAHAHGVIHRDLKPANVLLDRHGRAQLVDFGLARDEAAGSRLTRSGVALGTPAYMPPEQARGERERVGRRSDLYSLGAILYEMLAGQAPFQGETVMEVLFKVTHTDPPPLRKLAPRVPAAVEAVCMKAMEKDPARRYASAFQLLQDLRACLAGEEPPVAWSGRTTGIRRLVRRAGLRAALLALALLAGSIYWASLHAKAQHVARLVQKGQSLMSEGHYAEADVQFMEAQNLDPSSAAAFLGRQEARHKLEEADQARQAAERARQEDLARQVREALGSLDTKGLKDAAKGGTERLTELIAELLRGGETAETPAPGTVRWEFLSHAPGAEVRVLPLTGETPVFSGRTPARADLTPGLYRLRYQVAGREERELVLPVCAGPARKLTLDEDGKPVEK